MSLDPTQTTLLQRMNDALQLPMTEVGVAPVMQLIQESIDTEGHAPALQTELALAMCARIRELLQDSELQLSFLAVWLKGLGALIEFGADIEAVGPAIANELALILDELCYHYMRFSQGVEGLSEEQNAAYLEDVSSGLGEAELATAAILSRSHHAREVLRAHPHLPRYFRLLRWNFGFLHKAGFVLDEEPVLFLAPEGGWGFELVFSGISDNYQLQAIVSSVLAELWPEHFEAMPDDILNCYWGTGAPEVPATFFPEWQTLLWTAWDGNELSMESHHFIWGAGIPADIMKCPVLDGKRVVFLTNPPYQRSINVNRDFEGLQVSCRMTKLLSSEELEAALSAIASISDEERLELLQAHATETHHNIFA